MTEPPALRSLAADIERDLGALDRVHAEAQEVLLRYAEEPPEPLERRIPAGVIHDYYTGVEAALGRIANHVNGQYPGGGQSHRQLLSLMTLEVPEVRPPVLSEESRRELDELRKFRHYFRHAYRAALDWDQLQPHVQRLTQIHETLKGELQTFVAFLRQLAADLEAGVQ